MVPQKEFGFGTQISYVQIPTLSFNSLLNATAIYFEAHFMFYANFLEGGKHNYILSSISSFFE